MRSYITLILLLQTASLFSQSALPVIRATSKKVSIDDGGVFSPDSWNLSPKARPDIYTADRALHAKIVTFYTDIDSFRVKVKPGRSYDFVILLNGRDSCFTRISSAIPPDAGEVWSSSPDTIPFRLTDHNAIAIKAVVNEKDTLDLHVDISSSGIHFLQTVMSRRYAQQKIGTLQIGHTQLKNPAVSTTVVTAQEMDGRVGYTVFEGRQVEINYDLGIVVVHPKMPSTKGYTRTRLIFDQSIPCVDGAFVLGQQEYTGHFMLDNGSSQSLIVDSGWVARSDLAGRFQLVKTSFVKDSRGIKHETKLMRAPVFRFGGGEVKEVPVTLFAGRNPLGFEVNYLGNDLLKRYNMILDFKHDYVYFKADHLLNTPYLASSGG